MEIRIEMTGNGTYKWNITVEQYRNLDKSDRRTISHYLMHWEGDFPEKGTLICKRSVTTEGFFKGTVHWTFKLEDCNDQP